MDQGDDEPFPLEGEADPSGEFMERKARCPLCQVGWLRARELLEILRWKFTWEDLAIQSCRLLIPFALGWMAARGFR